MIGTTGAIIASAVIGAGVSLFGASQQSAAADKAITAQTDASKTAIAESKRQYNQTRKDLKPWREAGKTALTQISEGIASGAFDPSNFQFEKDPGYDFRLSEGTRALERSAAARGNLFSGATGKAITQYGQDFASDEYDRAYARAANAKATNYNILASQAGQGQVATNGLVSAGNTNTSNIIAANQNNASAIGQYGMAGANAWAQGGMNVGGALNTGLENYLLYKAIG